MTNPLSGSGDIIYLHETDSTMLAARRLAASSGSQSPPASGTVIRAGYQAMGRGRLFDRRWEAAPGEALMFTIIFTLDDLRTRMRGRAFTLLPLLCGLAVAEAVEDYLETTGSSADLSSAADIRIKWPNDILAGGRKLSGILCEASGDWVYAGIGINLNQAEFPAGLRRPAVSLRSLAGCSIEADEILSPVLERLNTVLGCSDWRERIEQRLYGKDTTAVIVPAAGSPESGGIDSAEGVIKGINPEGALLMECSGRLLPFVSGELRL